MKNNYLKKDFFSVWSAVYSSAGFQLKNSRTDQSPSGGGQPEVPKGRVSPDIQKGRLPTQSEHILHTWTENVIL